LKRKEKPGKKKLQLNVVENLTKHELNLFCVKKMKGIGQHE